MNVRVNKNFLSIWIGGKILVNNKTINNIINNKQQQIKV